MGAVENRRSTPEGLRGIGKVRERELTLKRGLGIDPSVLGDPEQFSPDFLDEQKKLTALWDGLRTEQNFELVKTPKARKLLALGVPQHLRGELWMSWSGAKNHMAANPGYYESLLKDHGNEQSEAVKDIQKAGRESY